MRNDLSANDTAHVVRAQMVRPQYWRVVLECGHVQEVHSVRDGGPLYVLRCQTCQPGKARLRKAE